MADLWNFQRDSGLRKRGEAFGPILGRESELGPGGSGVLVLRLSVFWFFGISSFASEQVLAWNDPLAGKRMLTWWYRRFPYGKIAVLPLR